MRHFKVKVKIEISDSLNVASIFQGLN